MMCAFCQLSIKHKLRVATLAGIALALTLPCISFASYDWLVFRYSLVPDLETLAEILGANSTAALSFNDQNAAVELLSALRAKPHVRKAIIYNAEGTPFASYVRAGEPGDFKIPFLRDDTARFGVNRLILFHRIKLGENLVGVIYLESDLAEMHQRLVQFGWTMLIVLILASVPALFLGHKLQSSLAMPLIQLAGTARRIAAQKDYSARAPAIVTMNWAIWPMISTRCWARFSIATSNLRSTAINSRKKSRCGRRNWWRLATAPKPPAAPRANFWPT